MERIKRKGERPVYQPAITRETCHRLWEVTQWRSERSGERIPMTVILQAIIDETHMVEEMMREERLVESGYAPTVFVRPPGEEEYRPYYHCKGADETSFTPPQRSSRERAVKETLEA
jgi:hypothetical protein